MNAYSLHSSFSRTVRPCHYSAGCSLLLCRPPDSAFSRTSAFHSRYILNRYPSATALLCRTICRRNAFPPTSVSHPARLNCHSLPCLVPSLWTHDRSSPARTLPAVFRRCRRRTQSHLNTSAYRFLPPRFCSFAHASVFLVCHATTTGHARSLSCKAIWRSQVAIPCATLLAQDAPHTTTIITRHIADNVEDRGQYFCVCFVTTFKMVLYKFIIQVVMKSPAP